MSVRRACALSLAVAALAPRAAAAAPLAPPPPDGDEAEVDAALARVDYDAPDPGRDALSFAKAGAYTAFANYAVFQFDWFTNRPYIRVTGKSLQGNFREGFEWDKDPLQTNFFGHPLHGAMYFGSARASGLGFWESVPYALGGSLSWELLGETERPSANDLAATTLGGVFLGEIMHRLSSQVLDDSATGTKRLLREVTAAVFDIPRGLDRLLTGKAWATGPAPERRPLRVGLDLGLDRVRLEDYGGVPGQRDLTPSAMAAIQIEYGDFKPRIGRDTMGPLETFDLYAAANVLQREVTGVQLFEHGLLYGFSSDMTDDVGASQDNNVFGFFQTFDFQGANLATFGALAFGPGDELVFRTRSHGRIHVGASAEWVPVLGITSDNTGPSPRGYNIATGAALGLYAKWDLGRLGRFGFRARNYVGSVVDGAEGVEYVGYTRLSYEFDIVHGLFGVGLAPASVQRLSNYARGPEEEGTQVSTQLYLVVHN